MMQGRLTFGLARKGFQWSTEGSDTRSALGSSGANGLSPFILRALKAREELSPAPVSERSC